MRPIKVYFPGIKLKRGFLNEKTGRYFWGYKNGMERWCSMERLVRTRVDCAKRNALTRSLDREADRIYQREYRAKNKERVRMWTRNKMLNRRGKPVSEMSKLAGQVRVRVSRFLRAFNVSKRSIKSEQLFGCTIEYLRHYIERKFTPGMSWDNYGKWHIDHKIPMAFAKTREMMLHLCRYHNLQPLWASDNIRKGRHFMITIKLDVMKIDKAKLFQGAKGKYLDLVLIETPNSEYGDYMVVQSVTKEERLAGVRGAILGNAKILGQKPASAPQPQAAPASSEQVAEDEIPF